jgi:hypothetical protein
MLERHITKTITWGLDPKFSGSKPTAPPVQGVAPTVPTVASIPSPNWEKFFAPFVITDKMCDVTVSANVLKKRINVKNAEDCAKHCMKRRLCTHVNYRPDVIRATNCQLFKNTCVQINATDGYLAYTYGKPDVTPQPTISGLSNFVKYFQNNIMEGVKCRTNRNTYFIEQDKSYTLELCATKCVDNQRCTHINYDPVTLKCDLIKECSENANTAGKMAYKKVDTVGGNSVDSSQVEVVFEKYFGTKNKVNNSKYCQMEREDQVLEYELELTREDCAARCILQPICKYINYDSSQRFPCTLLKKCEQVDIESGTPIESFLNADSADYAEPTTDTSDSGKEGPFFGYGFGVGFVVAAALALGLLYCSDKNKRKQGFIAVR